MDTPTVSIRSDVASELAFAARYRPDAYQACILLGNRVAGGLDVRGFIDLDVLDGPFLFLRTLVDDWVAMCRRASRAAPNTGPAGWASIRPGSDAAMSPAEQIVHRTFFNLPHQISLIVDPASERMRAYGANADGELVPVALVTPERAHSDGASP